MQARDSELKPNLRMKDSKQAQGFTYLVVWRAISTNTEMKHKNEKDSDGSLIQLFKSPLR